MRWFSIILSSLLLFGFVQALEKNAERPNILWVTCEDMGPHLGCYGDTYAKSPNLDTFAEKSLRYKSCWSNAPVCAPARTTLISGVYPPSTGSEHMRSLTKLPKEIKMYPQLLREAGYYCTNNVKEDYNLEKPPGVWDESSAKAHYKNRKKGQPFFAIFNFTVTHESQIRDRKAALMNDPSKVRIPAYHPDTPEVRRDWAVYYDNITRMDTQVGKVLDELKTEGLDKDTIVFFYSDHGSGMPRNKRTPLNTGLHVPLLIHFPEKYKHLAPQDYKAGGTTEQLVSFVDMAPTLLSLIGQKAPEWMQGSAFLGTYASPPKEYIYGFRGRMDERYDFVRSVRDARYVYARNYMPHLPYGQHVSYMFITPTTQVWKRLYDEGKLKPEQAFFWKQKPPEELYDLQNDPDQVKNLADSPEHQKTLERLRKAQQELALKIRDVGFLPEDEIHSRSQGITPYEMGHDDKKYPIKKIHATAETAASLKKESIPSLVHALRDTDSAVRYWGALGLRMLGSETVRDHHKELTTLLKDSAPAVQIVAAEALAQFGDKDDVASGLEVLVKLANHQKHGVYVANQSLNALDALEEKAKLVLPKLKELPAKVDMNNRGAYGIRLVNHIISKFEKKKGD